MKAHSHIDTIKINRLSDHDVLFINGWAFDENGMPGKLTLYINGDETEFISETVVRPDVEWRFMHQSEGIYYSGFKCKVFYKDRICDIRLCLDEHDILSINSDAIEKIVSKESIIYNIDGVGQDNEGNVKIRGWALSLNHADIHISLIGEKTNNPLSAEIRVINTSGKKEFIIMYRKVIGNHGVICFSSDKDKSVKVPVPKSATGISEDSKFKRLIKKISWKNIKKFFIYCGRFGFKETLKMVFTYKGGIDYDKWFKARRITTEIIEQQKNSTFKYSPKISILVPAYNTPVELLKRTVKSVQNQSYGKWQLCIAFAGDNDAPAIKTLKELEKSDSRIKRTVLKQNLGISENTNKALELADGDFIALFDHDDLLEPDALFEIVKAINENCECQAFYTDEDKYDSQDHRFKDPNLKPDFNIDLLRSCNYITHFLVVKKEVMDTIGGLHKEYDGAQDYDLILRITEKIGEIKHIPKILYHWRMMSGSTALAPESKNYAYTAGEKALGDHLKRCGIVARAEMQGKPNYGLYNAFYEPVSEPLISVVFNGNSLADARQNCVKSIQTNSSYKNIEFVNSVDNAKGELLLFLDENTELISSDSIKNMAGFFERHEVGVVGAKLLYDDDTVEHAGVIIGVDGFAEYANKGVGRDQPGYMMRALLNCDYSAVSGACLMTRRNLFEELGGFDKNYKVCGRDIDYCMRIRRKNLLVVYNATSLWYHYTRKFYRGTYNREQAEKDIAFFQKRFMNELNRGDPYYNPGFSMKERPFLLKD